MIRSYETLGAGNLDPVEQHLNAVRRRERTTAEYEKRLKGRGLSSLIPVRLWLFRRLVRQMSDIFPWRENARFYGVRTFLGGRQVFLEIGRRLQQRGDLQSMEDVFFLTVPELLEQDRTRSRSPQSLRDLIREREALWRSQLDREAPLVVRSDGKRCAEDPQAAVTGDRMKGLAASSGRVTGTARIIRDPSQSHRFKPGEILVAPYTEPGWAPLFLLARGLAIELGGFLCHGAIVAREYSIPAVVGLKGATTAIRDGDRITIDGDRGEVILHGRMSDSTANQPRALPLISR
jgi:pyruvate,water dikinase